MDLITRSLLLCLILCIAITLQSIQNTSGAESNQAVSTRNTPNYPRDRRGFIYKKKPPGAIRQIFGIIYEQWNDTRNTWSSINNLVSSQFGPDNATTTTPAPNLNANVSTTRAPYVLTRAEFARIIRRNLKGLMRLYNIELQDALKQSEITQREFRKNVTKEVAKFL